MKDNEVKKSLDKINIDDSTKTRILNNIQIKEQQINENKGFFSIFKNTTIKYMTGAIAGTLVIGCIFIATNNTNTEQIHPPQISGTSPQFQEKLAIVGVIEEISDKEDGVLLKVVGSKEEDSVYENISVYAHASTNIFEDNKDDLLGTSDLRVGQKVNVYYDGTEIENSNGEINSLSIIIIED